MGTIKAQVLSYTQSQRHVQSVLADTTNLSKSLIVPISEGPCPVRYRSVCRTGAKVVYIFHISKFHVKSGQKPSLGVAGLVLKQHILDIFVKVVEFTYPKFHVIIPVNV